MLKISFDFDCTLGETIIQKVAKMMLAHPEDCEIYIVTARIKGEGNWDLWSVAKRLNIPNERIFFTEGAYKWNTINRLEIDIHFDDVPEECELIATRTACLPILLWDEYCKGSVKEENFGKEIY